MQIIVASMLQYVNLIFSDQILFPLLLFKRLSMLKVIVFDMRPLLFLVLIS